MDSEPLRRYHSLDALRAAMMLLGLVLHSAASYTRSPLGAAWPYQDPQTSVAFDLLVFFIHLFRMPVFFVVAGFFAALLYDRDGAGGFARNRLKRVLLPLVLFWPLVIPLIGLAFTFSVSRVGGRTPFELVAAEPILRQPLLGHLWFLYHLLFLYIAVSIVVPIANRLPSSLQHQLDAASKSIVSKRWGIIVLSTVTTVTLLPMKHAGLDLSASLVPAMRVLIAYGVFFAFGWLLYRERERIPSFGTRWKSRIGAGSLAAIVYLFMLVAKPIADPTALRVAAIIPAALAIWLLIFGIVGMFVRHMEKPRPLVRYFSDASYWMYVVHLPATAAIPGVLAYSPAPAFVKFAIVLWLTTLVTAVTYHYLVRATVVGELLNGRRYPRSLRGGLSVRDGAAV